VFSQIFFAIRSRSHGRFLAEDFAASVARTGGQTGDKDF
jgi:hypothetical protein